MKKYLLIGYYDEGKDHIIVEADSLEDVCKQVYDVDMLNLDLETTMKSMYDYYIIYEIQGELIKQDKPE